MLLLGFEYLFRLSNGVHDGNNSVFVLFSYLYCMFDAFMELVLFWKEESVLMKRFSVFIESKAAGNETSGASVC